MATSPPSATPIPPFPSTSSSEGLPANPSPSPASEVDWMTTVATSRLSIQSWLTLLLRDGSSGKTSLEFSPPPAVMTSRPSSPPSREFLSILPQKDGRIPASLSALPADTPSPGELLTLNTSEFPSAGGVCSLSDILETGELPQRYFLSATACRGILRRAEKRGKELPALLRLALIQVAGDKTLTSQPESTCSPSQPLPQADAELSALERAEDKTR